jgi:riboflavin kinase / FMN adenylyltransferase
MKIHRELEELRGIRNPVVTTGSFDGVHVGHKAIIRRLKKLARDIDGETVLITFNPHPRRVLYPEAEGKDLLMILSQNEKIELLEKTGLDHLLIINFTKEFSEISSNDFIEKILVGILKARIVVVGYNHQFGHRREGDFEYLYKLSRTHNFEVEEIPEQDIQNESVSSTKIRTALLLGNIQRANAYLDHFYIIKGIAEFLSQKSTDFKRDIFSISIEENVKLVPPDGVYAISIACESFNSKGILSIRNWELKNNFLSDEIEIEFHPLENGNPVDKRNITVYFHKRLRDATDRSDAEYLRLQLDNDIRMVGELIY